MANILNVDDSPSMLRSVSRTAGHSVTSAEDGVQALRIAQGAQKQRARTAGANGWLVKPFEPEKLLAIVKKVA